MTREEMMKRLEDLKERKFYLNMVDRWTREDYRENDKIMMEMAELREALKKI